MKEEQLHDLKLQDGLYVGSPEYILASVKPVQGG
jgi:hypothetical protein